MGAATHTTPGHSTEQGLLLPKARLQRAGAGAVSSRGESMLQGTQGDTEPGNAPAPRGEILHRKQRGDGE